ncbi:type-F conjugative transfer system secretin TraK [Vibrio cholerae]
MESEKYIQRSETEKMKKPLLIALSLAMSTPVFATKMAEIEAQSSPKHSNKAKAEQLQVISSQHVNRIVTPFNNPSIKLDNVEGVSYKNLDNVLYLSTQHDTNVGGWITEGGDESTAIRVLFKPMPVPPQEIVLEETANKGSEIARRFEQSSPRTTSIVNVLSAIATGNLPSGYKQQEVNASYLPKCQQSGLTFEFYNGQFFSGGDYVVSIGTANNKTAQSIEFAENNCYQDGVVAVNAYPYNIVKPNSKVEVLVMYHRLKAADRREPKRQSLLTKGQ